MKDAATWSRLRDSNPQPPVYKTGALPIAPSRQEGQSTGGAQPRPYCYGVGVGVGVASDFVYASLESVSTNCANSFGLSSAPE